MGHSSRHTRLIMKVTMASLKTSAQPPQCQSSRIIFNDFLITCRFLQPVRMTEMASCELLAISAGAVSTRSLPRAPSATSSPSLKLNEEPWAPSRRRCCCVAALATLPPRPAPDPAFPKGIPQKTASRQAMWALHSFFALQRRKEITKGTREFEKYR